MLPVKGGEAAGGGSGPSFPVALRIEPGVGQVVEPDKIEEAGTPG